MREKSKEQSTLWGGRFTQPPADAALEISESISFDHKLADVDIDGSIAHAKMLGKQKIISNESVQNIIAGLEKVRSEIHENKLEFRYDLEDIHTHVERRLVELIGEDGKRLHTGRSRNDQVAVDTVLFLKQNIQRQWPKLNSLLETILRLAEENDGKIWAGYTHTQIAQPVSLAHYLMSWFWKFSRDRNLLRFALAESDVCPLGSAAMAGPNYPVDRLYVAKELGFSRVTENSMDAVSNRDYQLSYHFFASRLFLHTSRLCEDLILYSTAEFGYVKMSDAVTTGSSIMPQKKNPDIAELLRGKSARVVGNFHMLMMNLKSLPMTYNRDLQEDKVYLFDTVKQVDLALDGLREILENTTFFPDKVRENLNKGFAQATDMADYLVSEYRMAFREAHEVIGKIVLACEQGQYTLESLPEEKLTDILPEGITIPPEVRSLDYSLHNKKGLGSTSRESIQKQFEQARNFLKE